MRFSFFFSFLKIYLFLIGGQLLNIVSAPATHQHESAEVFYNTGELRMCCAVKNKGILLLSTWASPVAQMVKNLLAMQETCVWSLGWENPPEKEMVTRSSILAWEIPWTEEPGGL